MHSDQVCHWFRELKKSLFTPIEATRNSNRFMSDYCNGIPTYLFIITNHNVIIIMMMNHYVTIHHCIISTYKNDVTFETYLFFSMISICVYWYFVRPIWDLLKLFLSRPFSTPSLIPFTLSALPSIPSSLSSTMRCYIPLLYPPCRNHRLSHCWLLIITFSFLLQLGVY